MTITVHHLNFSRSSRIIWLLEALKLDYNIKVYKRKEDFFAPKELTDLTPLGKSPVLEIDGKLYTESGFLFQLLLERYNKVFTSYSQEQWDKIHFYLHFTEGTLMAPILILYLVSREDEKATQDRADVAWGMSNTLKCLKFLEDELANSGTGFFIDNNVSPADIMLHFSVAFGRGQVENFDSKFPGIKAWLSRIEADPVYLVTEAKIKEAEAACRRPL